MSTVLSLGVTAITLLIMAVVGTELAPRDFGQLAHRRGTLAVTLLLPAVLLPALGLALARVLVLPPHLSAGLLLLAACPVGDIVNLYTLLARGNIALAVVANVLTCLLSVVTMGLAFAAYGRLGGQHYGLTVPTSAIVTRLTLMVAVPVLAGMALRRWAPAWVAARRRVSRNLCIAGTGLLLAYVLAKRWAQVAAEWQPTMLASASFMLAALLIGLAVARGLRLNAPDTVTVAFVFAVRNVAIALAVAVTIMNRIEFSGIAALYFMAEVPLLLGTVWVYRRRWG